jgi:NADP-dependent 3-hydroxy acid dehydrogenase YdfG
MTLVCRAFTLGLVLAFVTPALAVEGQGTQTATEFYQAYRKVLAKAQKIEELLPMMGASRRAQVEKTPADERNMMFEMIKEMTAEQGDIKVLKETATANGAELAVQAKNGVGTVTLVKEGGGWKVDKESWKSK